MGTDFVTAADGHCGDCQSSIRIEYAHCEEGNSASSYGRLTA